MEISKRKITNAQQGFCVRRAEVQNSTAVFQLNFSNKTSFCASISRPNAKPETVSGYVKKNETNRMEKWKSNVWLIIIICAVIIGYPFFAIKYFETSTALKIVVKYFLLPIVIFLLIYGPKFYYRSVKPLDNCKSSA